MSFHVIILAAGQGVRMKSSLPKVLHPLAGKPMLFRLLDTALSLEPKDIRVVVGHQGSDIVQSCQAHYRSADVLFVEQKEQLGTAHAVAQAMSDIQTDASVLVLYGDVPLIQRTTLLQLIDQLKGASLAVLSTVVSNPKGYGRICRDAHGCVEKIVEEKDADEATKQITEINTGIMAIKGQCLVNHIPKITNNNAQAEFYLTDIVGLCVSADDMVVATQAKQAGEVLGINNRAQLAAAERAFQMQQAENMMQEGLALLDPARFDLRGDLQFGQDVMIDIGVVMEGNIRIGDGVFVGAHCFLKNVVIEEGAMIHPFSHLEKTHIGANCQVGPFARCRSGTYLHDDVKLGNFVETKKAAIGASSKVNHLSYVGDAEIGEAVNIGAGVVFCNYDGADKYQTCVENGVFVGSNSSLVAPVRLEKEATIGAGSVITKDAPADQLTLARARQMTLDDWRRHPKKSTTHLSSNADKNADSDIHDDGMHHSSADDKSISSDTPSIVETQDHPEVDDRSNEENTSLAGVETNHVDGQQDSVSDTEQQQITESHVSESLSHEPNEPSERTVPSVASGRDKPGESNEQALEE